MPHALQAGPQPGLAGDLADQLHLGAGEVHGGGSDGEALDLGGAHDLAQRKAVPQAVVGGGLDAVLGDAEAGGGVALRVHVHHQHGAAGIGEAGAEVDGGGGFTHPALLVDYRYHDSHYRSPPGARRLYARPTRMSTEERALAYVERPIESQTTETRRHREAEGQANRR